MGHFVYLLRCRDNTLYTGYTTDLDRRLKQHQEGKAAKYTRGRRPLFLVGYLEFSSRGEALAAEAKVKTMSPNRKLLVITGEEHLS
ncbi:MAG TPA: GIY-YIG nuclease family protein [Firmicutes bacterium]|jgi:putative endonuclease|nr:GIY-YIG nuclease family protein [Bacillota bacterium]